MKNEEYGSKKLTKKEKFLFLFTTISVIVAIICFGLLSIDILVINIILGVILVLLPIVNGFL
jgi:hypothetical protein